MQSRFVWFSSVNRSFERKYNVKGLQSSTDSDGYILCDLSFSAYFIAKYTIPCFSESAYFYCCYRWVLHAKTLKSRWYIFPLKKNRLLFGSGSFCIVFFISNCSFPFANNSSQAVVSAVAEKQNAIKKGWTCRHWLELGQRFFRASLGICF